MCYARCNAYAEMLNAPMLTTACRVLLELDSREDPVSVFLESQHEHIRTLMRAAYDTHAARIQGTCEMRWRDRSRFICLTAVDLDRSLRLQQRRPSTTSPPKDQKIRLKMYSHASESLQSKSRATVRDAKQSGRRSQAHTPFVHLLQIGTWELLAGRRSMS